MKKLLFLTIILVVLVLTTGCGENKTTNMNRLEESFNDNCERKIFENEYVENILYENIIYENEK